MTCLRILRRAWHLRRKYGYSWQSAMVFARIDADIDRAVNRLRMRTGARS